MNKNMFDYICCPKCKDDLTQEDDFLICEKCAERYTIKEGIPVLIHLKKIPKHCVRQINIYNKLIDTIEYKIAAWQQRYVDRFKDNFREIENKLVVDCGTGAGYMAIELAKLRAHVIACDLALESLIKLKKIAEKMGLQDQIIFICCSAEELPFKNDVANYFISSAVLEHLLNEKQAKQEINRCCDRNAGLMIATPLRYKLLHPLFIPINFIHDKRIGHLRRYDEKTLINKFTNWELIKTYYTGHFSKAIKVLLNIFVKLFNEEKIEEEDVKKVNKRYGASNIICFFKRRPAVTK